jgi:hypothetical protein
MVEKTLPDSCVSDPDSLILDSDLDPDPLILLNPDLNPGCAEYGSNPDPDHSFYDKIVTCEPKNFVGIKNGHISLLKPLKRTFRLQKNRSATLNLKLEIYSFFLFVGTDLSVHDLCPTLLC